MIQDLRQAKLWCRLKFGFAGTEHERLAETLALHLLDICAEAGQRMKSFPALHPQYTLHDEVHLYRVVELMGRILPSSVVQGVLNPVEIALLILCAYFHDQGMVLNPEELGAMESDPKFQVFRSNWEIEHPNLLEIRDHILQGNLSDAERRRCLHAEQE